MFFLFNLFFVCFSTFENNTYYGLSIFVVYLILYSMNKDEKFQFVDMVSNHMIKIGCTPAVAQFVAFQFALESNFGRSNMAKKKNNLCGMKAPSLRPSFNVGPNGPNVFASYSTFVDCLNDYCLWLSYNKFTLFDLSNLDLFQERLKAKHYCPEEDYIERIINLQNQTKF